MKDNICIFVGNIKDFALYISCRKELAHFRIHVDLAQVLFIQKGVIVGKKGLNIFVFSLNLFNNVAVSICYV